MVGARFSCCCGGGPRMKKNCFSLGCYDYSFYLCTRLTAKRFDSLAQLVEHNTFNVGVLGSNPKRITIKKSFQILF